MKRRKFIVSSALGSMALNSDDLVSADTESPKAGFDGRKILIAGGGFREAFIRYMADLTGKDRPRICYLPTASADRPSGIISWFQNCANLNVVPFVQESFISSYRMDQSFEDVLLSMDGIVVSGGNTLNQQAIWKVQGIDLILKEAWDRGIVFLKGSHSPHYDAEAARRPLYHKLIKSGELMPGYACDNDAGIYFEDNEVKRVVSTREEAKVYYVSKVGNDVVEKVMEPERID